MQAIAISAWPMLGPNHHGPRRAILFQSRQHAGDLAAATIDPVLRRLLVQHAFVNKRHGLVRKPRAEGRDLQRLATLDAAFGDQGPGPARHLVERIQNGEALDQHFPVIEHKRGHAAQRIDRGQLVLIAENRPRAMFETETVKPHGNGDTPHVRGIELADKDHEHLPDWSEKTV